MPIVKPVPIHTVKHIWEAYATRQLKEHPDWYGRRHNKIRNFHLYKPVNDKPVLIDSYQRFRKIVERYFEKAKTAIIQGEALDLTSNVGKIAAIRVQRDFTKKSHLKINWHKTMEYSAKHGKVWLESKQKFVHPKLFYFTEDDWCRIGWHKNYKIANDGWYEFVPTASDKIEEGRVPGFNNEFRAAINADPTLKYRFIFKPIYVPKTKVA